MLTIEHLNRAFTELSKARHITKSTDISAKDYQRIKDLFNVLGKMRLDYLDQLVSKNVT